MHLRWPVIEVGRSFLDKRSVASPARFADVRLRLRRILSRDAVNVAMPSSSVSSYRRRIGQPTRMPLPARQGSKFSFRRRIQKARSVHHGGLIELFVFVVGKKT